MNNPGKPPKKRGRKTRSKIEVLRTKFWAESVLEASRENSAYGLEKLINPAQVRYADGTVHRPRKWDRYLSGSHSPTADSEDSAIAMAEQHFPGTASVFLSPIWRALESRNWTSEESVAALSSVPVPIPELTCQPYPVGESVTMLPSFSDAVQAKLIELGSFEALAALVVFVRLSEGIASPGLRDVALLGIGRLKGSLSKQSRGTRLAALYDELFRAIDLSCKHWEFLDPAQRIDIVIFGPGWEGAKGRYGNLIECATGKPNQEA